MVSIHTNAAGMSALSALRSASRGLADAQSLISTGFRVREAADNAAYWSISTTMRSDNRALAVVQDSLGKAVAIADVTYTALDQTRATLDEIKSKLVLAQQSGIDLHKVQQEIAALARHTLSIANSSSFAGSNWLATDIEDIYETEPELRSTYLTSSFGRAGSGEVNVGLIALDLHKTSLYNKDGGGILQSDPRSPGIIGGIRQRDLFADEAEAYIAGRGMSGAYARQIFTFSGPLAFEAGDSITFDITVDADNPSHGLSPPYDAGNTTSSITINRSVVDAVLPGAAGEISNYEQMIAVLGHVLQGTGAGATFVHDNQGRRIEGSFAIRTWENSNLDGSAVSISNFSNTVGSGGLSDFERWGSRGSATMLPFEPFKVYKDVSVAFSFGSNIHSFANFVIDRDLVDTVLEKDNGRVDTAEEMAALLEHLIGQDGLLIEVSGGGVIVRTDPEDDRLAGSRSYVGFQGVVVNIEPIRQYGLLEMDVASNPSLVRQYLGTVEAMQARIIDGAATVGALKSRIEMQMAFNSALQDSFARGIGQLVDADMNAASARLQALNVQQQLAIQALMIANAQPQSLLQMFGR
jgi:flagellin